MSDVRPGGLRDARVVAQMLHDFNREFDTPTPGVDAIEERLLEMLRRDDVVVLIAGEPPIGFALMTFRPIVWEPGPAVLLDELYVRPDRRSRGTGHTLLTEAMAVARKRGSLTFEINVDEGDVDAQRFYERHGFSAVQPESGERAFYYIRALQDDSGVSPKNS